jgi:hypothetical protein
MPGTRSNWSEIEERREQVRDNSRRLFILGAVVTVAFFAGTHFFGKPKDEPIPTRALEASIIQQPTIEAPRVIESPRPTYRQPSADSGRQSYVGVFECVVNGQRVVSDRPCGAEAQSRTLVVDQPDPADVARQRQQTWAAQQGAPRSSTGTAPASGGVPSTRTAPASNQAACESIERQIAYIDAQMREGYRSPQGEWYRQQLRVLKERRHDYRCLRGN